MPTEENKPQKSISTTKTFSVLRSFSAIAASLVAGVFCLKHAQPASIAIIAGVSTGIVGFIIFPYLFRALLPLDRILIKVSLDLGKTQSESDSQEVFGATLLEWSIGITAALLMSVYISDPEARYALMILVCTATTWILSKVRKSLDRPRP